MIDRVASLPPLLVLVLAVLVIAGEPALLVGVVLPSVSAAVLVGFVAHSGGLPVVAAVAVIAVAAAAGDTWAHRAGTRELTHLPPRLQPAWERATALTERRGLLAVALARWVVGLRTLLPRVVGAAGLPRHRFVAVDAVSSLAWASAYVGAGYLAGTSYQAAGSALGRAAGAVVGLVALAVVVVLVGRWIGRHPDPVRVALDVLPRRWVATTVRRALLGRRSRPWRTVLGVVVLAVGTTALSGVLLLGLDALVRVSGLARFDGALVAAMRDEATLPDDVVTRQALHSVSVLRGSFVVVAAAVLSVVLSWRGRARARTVLLPVGVFVPLAALALAVHLLVPSRPGTLFQSQVAVVAAAGALAAWSLGRVWPRLVVVVVGTGAALLVLQVATARVYLGWQSPSSVLLCLVLGLFWAVLLATAVVQAQAGRTPDPAPWSVGPPRDAGTLPAQPQA